VKLLMRNHSDPLYDHTYILDFKIRRQAHVIPVTYMTSSVSHDGERKVGHILGYLLQESIRVCQ
jgi:hypothetical protein